MAENSIHIEYNDELQPLDTLLRGVTRAGDFYATGTAEIPMPRVEVEGLGVLSFPVPESQIQELIRQATRAPYGRGEATLVHDFIADIVTRDYNGSENDALVTAASLLGAKPAGALLAGLARRHVRCLPAECVNLLGSLTARTGSSVPAEWRESLRGLAEAIVAGLSQIGEPAPEDDCRIWQIRERALPSDARLVIRLLGTLARLRRPRDWRQNVKLSCTCADCRELQQFALDPVEQVHRFRVRQDRRQHLHGQIEKHRLDMTHVTERKGSPQTLVCTKDRRSYQWRCEQYRQDIAALTALAELGGRPGIPTASLQSIATARERAAAWSPA